MQGDTKAAENTYFKLTSCRTIQKMHQRIDYVLRSREATGEGMVAWETHGFPADTPEEIRLSWARIILNHAKLSVGKAGRPIKKVGFHLVLSPGIDLDRFDDLKSCVEYFVTESLEHTFLVMAYHFDTNWLHAHLLINSVTPSLKALRLKPQDMESFRNAWYHACARYGIPSPMNAPMPRQFERKKSSSCFGESLIGSIEAAHIPFEDEEEEDLNEGDGPEARPKNGTRKRPG